MHFTSLADCSACRVQGAVVETWDTSAAAEHALLARCRMCNRTLESGVETTPAHSLARFGDVEQALARWAREEGHPTVAEFVASAFVLGTVPAVHTALIMGEPVETSFDVLGFLFSHAGGDSPGVAPADVPAAVAENGAGVFARVAPALGNVGLRGFDPRNELLALASVAAADGVVVAVEHAFLDEHAKSRGVDALTQHEIRVHRPDEAGPVGPLLERERVLEKMVQLAFVDGELDESEVRVIRGYARAWGIDPARIDNWLRAWGDDARGLFAKLAARAARYLFPEA